MTTWKMREDITFVFILLFQTLPEIIFFLLLYSRGKIKFLSHSRIIIFPFHTQVIFLQLLIKSSLHNILLIFVCFYHLYALRDIILN
jgi:hypothetical protein